MNFISTVMPMDEYLRLPAVSQGVLQTLLTECPKAAWFASYLNPNPPVETPKDEFDLGSIAHSVFLERSTACIAIIDPNDHPAATTGNIPDGWTNKSIKAARDVARGAGLIPILKPKMAQVTAMAAAADAFVESLRDTEPAIWEMFQTDGGESEVTATWDDDGVPCKMRVDRISADRTILCNYKTASGSVEPERFGRQLFNIGYDIGDAFYRRGAGHVFEMDAAHIFLVQSVEPPHLCSLVALDAACRAWADSRTAEALKAWRTCMEMKTFPGHPRRVAYIEPPGYLVAKWEAAKIAAYLDEA